MKKKETKEKLIVGWREWAGLPHLGVEMIKVKIDTGAKTASLHAFDLMPFTYMGEDWIQFDIHPLQDNDTIIHRCTAPIIDYRWITSSTGHSQQRYIIRTTLTIGDFSSSVAISLAKRDEMGFRMLIGRDALGDHILVNPSHSFLLTRRTPLTKK